MTPEERTQQIQKMTRELLKNIPYKKINERDIEKLFEKRRYQDIIYLMKRHMGIVCGLSVKCIVSTNNPQDLEHPATVELPANFYQYASRRQKELKITLKYYKSMSQSYHKFIAMLAHELAHIVLHSLGHPLLMVQTGKKSSLKKKKNRAKIVSGRKSKGSFHDPFFITCFSV